LPLKKGYPLWKPKAYTSRLPEIYKQEGVHIGDVGMLNESGGFDYLFNACHPANDPLNIGRVPPGFKPMDIDYDDIVDDEREYGPSSHIPSHPSHILKSRIETLGPTLPWVPEEVGAGLSFRTRANKGALLILPEGGKRVDHQQISKFCNYAADCAQSWYSHVNGPLARGAHNGALYLVTGFDKARAWGVAAFTDVEEGDQVALDFEPKVSASIGEAAEYWFRRSDFAWSSCDADVSKRQSGCVFLRGFKISVRRNHFLPPKISSKVTDIRDLSADELLSKSKEINSSDSPFKWSFWFPTAQTNSDTTSEQQRAGNKYRVSY
ncbi:hypothetical protein BDP27DRAFT_1215769, partial [Rhodocollybia butyracea]